MEKETQILICGDICPTDDTKHLFENSNVEGLFNDVLPVLNKADLLLANLEFPLIDTFTKIKKTGPVLTGKSTYINIFKNAGFNVLGLANNHIKDAGEEGVNNTLKICEKYKINTVGAGKNLEEAKKTLIVEKNGYKIGILAFAEHEFNLASETEAGANNFDVYNDFDTIKSLKEEVDYVIVLFHGGIEYYEYPSPLLQKKCRKMIESGADLITCQHSHCIGTTENYLKGTIVYGQGNTVFGYRKNNPNWNEGLLIKISLNSNKESLQSNIEYIPVEAKKEGIDIMKPDVAEKCLNSFYKRSRSISDKAFVLNSWNSFCNAKKWLYMPWLLGLNRVLIHFNKLIGHRLIKVIYAKKRIRTSLNVIRCESHNEVLNTILEKYIKE